MVLRGDGTAVAPANDKTTPATEPARAPAEARRPPRRARKGLLAPYKPEQGKVTRRSTFVGAMAVIAWGGWYVNDQLRFYEGDEWWRLLITPVIGMLFAVVLGVAAWWVSFVAPKAGDFFISTEGEMKKVSWSTKGEVIGSTRVVIAFTVLLAALLFCVDLVFQNFFFWLGVLKVSG